VGVINIIGAAADWTGLSITSRWQMNDANVSGTTITDIVGGINGTAGSSVTSGAGPFTQARAIADDVNGYITLGSNPIANLNSAWSFAVWALRATNFAAPFDGGIPRLLNFTDGTVTINAGIDVAGTNGGSVGSLEIFNTGGSPQGITTAAAMTTGGVWVHWVTVWDGGAATFYVNGSAVTSTTSSGTGTGAGNTIGARAAGARPWGGSLYQAVVADAAWSAGQVSRVYNNR